jgi:hypothetical protein
MRGAHQVPNDEVAAPEQCARDVGAMTASC